MAYFSSEYACLRSLLCGYPGLDDGTYVDAPIGCRRETGRRCIQWDWIENQLAGIWPMRHARPGCSEPVQSISEDWTAHRRVSDERCILLRQVDPRRDRSRVASHPSRATHVGTRRATPPGAKGLVLVLVLHPPRTNKGLFVNRSNKVRSTGRSLRRRRNSNVFSKHIHASILKPFSSEQQTNYGGERAQNLSTLVYQKRVIKNPFCARRALEHLRRSLRRSVGRYVPKWGNASMSALFFRALGMMIGKTKPTLLLPSTINLPNVNVSANNQSKYWRCALLKKRSSAHQSMDGATVRSISIRESRPMAPSRRDG